MGGGGLLFIQAGCFWQGVRVSRQQACNKLANGVTAVSPAIAQYRRHESGGRGCQESLKCADNESKWSAFDTNNK